MKWHMNSKTRLFAMLVCGGVCCFGCSQTPLRAPGFAAKKLHVDESQMAMARLNERQGQDTAAKDAYEKVLTVDPEQQTAHHRLAVIAAEERRFQDADAHFRQAFALGPADAELLADAGYLFYLTDRLDEAERALRSALDQDPSNVRSRNNLGLVYGQQGRFDEAFAMFREAASKESNDAGAYANMAYVYAQHHMLDQAQSHYSRALTLDANLRPAAEAMVQLAEVQPPKSKPSMTASRSRQRAADPIEIEDVVAHSTNSRRPQARLAERSISTAEHMNRTLAATASTTSNLEPDSPAESPADEEVLIDEVLISDANRTALESETAAEQLIHTASAAQQLIHDAASRVGPAAKTVVQGPVLPPAEPAQRASETESDKSSSPAARAALTPTQVVTVQPEMVVMPQDQVVARRSPVVHVTPEFPTPTPAVTATANRAAVIDRSASVAQTPTKSEPQTTTPAAANRYATSTPSAVHQPPRISTPASTVAAPATPATSTGTLRTRVATTPEPKPSPTAARPSLLESAIAKGPPLPQAAPVRAAASPHAVPVESSHPSNKTSSNSTATAATPVVARAPSRTSPAKLPVVASTTRQSSRQPSTASNKPRDVNTQAGTGTSNRSLTAPTTPRELPSSRSNAAASNGDDDQSSTLSFGRTVSSAKPVVSSASAPRSIAPTSSGAQNSPSVVRRTSATIAVDDEDSGDNDDDYGFAIASDDDG